MKKIFMSTALLFIFASIFAGGDFTEIPNVVVSYTDQAVVVRTSDKCIAEEMSYSSQILRSYYENGERVFILEKDRYAYAVHFVSSASAFACNQKLSKNYDLERGFYYTERADNK
jgi:hypothetical protein